MRKIGIGLAAAGIWTELIAINTEPINLIIGAAGVILLVAGGAMLLYQSYRDEKEEEQEYRRRRTFQNWIDTTDLKETGRDETERI